MEAANWSWSSHQRVKTSFVAVAVAVAVAVGIPLVLAGASAARAQDFDGDWHVSAGGGIVIAPRSLGSARALVLPIPVIDARYRDHVFITDNPYEGLGVVTQLGTVLDLSAALGADLDTRDPGEDPHVRGLPKVGAAGALRLRAEHDASRWSATLQLSERLTARDRSGVTATAELAVNPLVTDRFLGSFGVNARLADHRWSETFLAVSMEQSQLTGLSQHPAHAGLLDRGLFVQAVYRIDDRWTAFARFADSRFTAVTAESPVISNRNDPLGLIFVSRTF